MHSAHVILQSLWQTEGLATLKAGMGFGNFLMNLPPVTSKEGSRGEGHITLLAPETTLDALVHVSDVLLQRMPLDPSSAHICNGREVEMLASMSW